MNRFHAQASEKTLCHTSVLPDDNISGLLPLIEKPDFSLLKDAEKYDITRHLRPDHRKHINYSNQPVLPNP